MVIFLKKQKYFKIEIELPSLFLLSQCPTMLFVALAWRFPFSIQPSTHKDLPGQQAGTGAITTITNKNIL